MSDMTTAEADIVARCLVDDEYFTHIYCTELKCSSTGLQQARERLHNFKDIFTSLLNNIKFNKFLAWGFPKGKLHCMEETPFDCAIREFKEEVEVDLPEPLYISNNYITERTNAINGNIIDSHYWLYIIQDEMCIDNVVYHEEISSRVWVDTSTCKLLGLNNSILLALEELVSTLK